MHQKKFCKDCSHFQQGLYNWCRNLKVCKVTFSPVVGERYTAIECEKARGWFGKCGPNGKYFESKYK